MTILRSIFKRGITPVAATLALVLATGSCRNEEGVVPAKGKMSFTFSAAQGAVNGRAQGIRRPDHVLVSVVDDQGNAREYLKLKLVAFGQGYVSEDLELATGHYRLTDFFVMDENRYPIYSTPKEGSTLAKFVNDPLDISFNIHEDENTQVRPQVLAVEDATKPGDFGYSSFAFDVVGVTAFILPETSEKIVKVSYAIRNSLKNIKGEVIPSGSLVDLNRPELLNSFVIDDISRVDLIVWTEPKECMTQYSHTPYQKVYRLNTEVIFNGAAFELPPFTSKRWDPCYYRTNHGIGFFFSANPLKSYHVEIQVADDIDLVAGYSWLDRRYWNASGGETCNLGEDAYTTVQMNGALVGRLRMEDKPVCETGNLYVIDSFVAVNSNKGAFHEFFSWTIVNGVAVPSCDASSSGRLGATAERRAPAGR